jgi:hypothetical protein
MLKNKVEQWFWSDKGWNAGVRSHCSNFFVDSDRQRRQTTVIEHSL